MESQTTTPSQTTTLGKRRRSKKQVTADESHTSSEDTVAVPSPVKKRKTSTKTKKSPVKTCNESLSTTVVSTAKKGQFPNCDLIHVLLEYLSGDYKALYSCFQVNRLWQQCTIKYLWKCPIFQTFGPVKKLLSVWPTAPRIQTEAQEYRNRYSMVKKSRQRVPPKSTYQYYLYIKKLSFAEVYEIVPKPIVSLTDIWSLVRRCPMLEELDLSGRSRTMHASLTGILNFIPKLKEINLYRCFNITDETVKKLLVSCPDLEKIHLGYCTKLTGRTALYMAVYGKKIHTIDFQGLFVEESSMEVLSLSFLPGFYPFIDNVFPDFNDTEKMTIAEIIAKINEALTELKSKFAYNVPDHTIFSKFINENKSTQRTKRLRHLNLKDTTSSDNVLGAFANNVPNMCNTLEYLNLGQCGSTNSGLKEFFSLGKTGAAHENSIFRKLEYLNLNCQGGLQRYTEDSLIQCLLKCPILKNLQLNGCTEFGKRLIPDILQDNKYHSLLDGLQVLSMKGTQINAYAVILLAQKCLDLEQFDVTDCPSLLTSIINDFVGEFHPEQFIQYRGAGFKVIRKKGLQCLRMTFNSENHNNILIAPETLSNELLWDSIPKELIPKANRNFTWLASSIYVVK